MSRARNTILANSVYLFLTTFGYSFSFDRSIARAVCSLVVTSSPPGLSLGAPLLFRAHSACYFDGKGADLCMTPRVGYMIPYLVDT